MIIAPFFAQWDQTHEALQNGHSDLKDFKSEQGLLEDASAGAAPCRYRESLHFDHATREIRHSQNAPAGDTLAPDWVSAIDELERNVGRLEAQMKASKVARAPVVFGSTLIGSPLGATQDLSTLHAKRLMVTFDETDELAQDQEIESAAQARRLHHEPPSIVTRKTRARRALLHYSASARRH